MNLTDTINYYANLLIIQYRNKPKAVATIKAIVSLFLSDDIFLQVQDAFDLDTAVGVQLDVLGKYTGVSRRGYAFDRAVTLGDDDYRTLIRLAIIKNNSGSSLAVIQDLLAVHFPGLILVSDNTFMGLNYLIIDSLGTPDLLAMISTGDFLPRPMGVQTSIVIVSAHTYPFFGFVTYEDPTPVNPPSPFNFYELYQLTYPWLDYNS